jgi:hypothetical protein
MIRSQRNYWHFRGLGNRYARTALRAEVENTFAPLARREGMVAYGTVKVLVAVLFISLDSSTVLAASAIPVIW